MDLSFDTLLTVLLIISAAIWIGGVITVIIVALVSKKTLDDEARVEFFRAFGRAYFSVAGSALAVTLVIGWSFLTRLDWSAELSRMAFASTLLVVVLIAGIVQARGLTRMRAALALNPGNVELAAKIQSRSKAATILRTLIVIVTLGLTVHASALLSSLL